MTEFTPEMRERVELERSRFLDDITSEYNERGQF